MSDKSETPLQSANSHIRALNDRIATLEALLARKNAALGVFATWDHWQHVPDGGWLWNGPKSRPGEFAARERDANTNGPDICPRCEGDGKAHGADRPFEWSGPGTYPGPCPVCKGSGKSRERDATTTEEGK